MSRNNHESCTVSTDGYCFNHEEFVDNVAPCSVCGKPLRVGEWGCISRIVEHAPSVQTTAFVAYFDFALGRQIDSLGDRRQAMKGEYDPHTGKVWGKLDYRDKMSKGDLSARDDRVQEQKRIERRR